MFQQRFVPVLWECIVKSLNIKAYIAIMIIMSIIHSIKAMLWINFTIKKSSYMLSICIGIDIFTYIIKYITKSISNKMSVDIVAILYNSYGIHMATFMGCVKVSSDGRKWSSKFNRFVRSIDNCVSWITMHMFDWLSLVTNTIALYYLSYKILVLLASMQITLFALVRFRSSKLENAKKSANSKADDYTLQITNLYSMFGLFGRDDFKIINRIKEKAIDIEKVYWTTHNIWASYTLIVSLLNILPMIFIAYTFDQNILMMEEILLIIITIQKIGNSFDSIIQFIANINKWNADIDSIMNFYEENKNNIIKDVEQLPIPKNFSLSINYTLENENRRFHIETIDPIDIIMGNKYLVDGVSGSGKTTFNRIICGYYGYGGDINHNIMHNMSTHNMSTHNMPTHNMSMHNFNSRICEISAGNFSSIDFSSTIREQMCYVNNINDDEINRLLNIVCLYDWVYNELGGIDVNIKGNISDGQKLRLSIAVLLTQTLSSDKDIIILDEIDQKIEETTAKQILLNIFSAFANKIIFVVVHTTSLKRSLPFNKYININSGLISCTNKFFDACS